MFIGILIFPHIGAICSLSRELIREYMFFLMFVYRLGHCVLFNRCNGQGHSILIEEEKAQRISPNTRGWAPSYTVPAGLCCSLNWWLSSSQAFPITYMPHSFTPKILDSSILLLPRFQSLVCCLCHFFHLKSLFCSFNNGTGFILLP